MGTAVQNAHVPVARRAALGRSLLRITICVVLFSAGGVYEAAHQDSLTSVANGNFWWHLRSGLWILQNHAVPHTGIYSQSTQASWITPSWLFDALCGIGYKLSDLRIVPMLLAFFRVLLALLTFLLAGGLRGKFWIATLLSALAQYILGAQQPSPTYVSLFCFGLELFLLLQSRRLGGVRPLLWLPVLLLMWANLDIDFVYGVLVLLLFYAALALEGFPRTRGVAGNAVRIHPPLKVTGGIVLLSLIATGITPYIYRLYGVFFADATSATNRWLPDYRAVSFRRPQDYLLLLLTMVAFLALGMRRSRSLFQISLLIVCAMLSFHLYSYAWLAVLTSVAVIGEAVPEENLSESSGGKNFVWHPLIAAGLAVAVFIISLALLTPRGRDALLVKMRESYPVDAADYICEHRPPQPLFNSYAWGGFLTWYLPGYPVAIDGRASLYGDDNIQYARFMRSEFGYKAYPPVSQARTILLEKNSQIAAALASVPVFKTAYSDNVAIVLVRAQDQP